jgi:long-chain acyl-CoA synthetase
MLLVPRVLEMFHEGLVANVTKQSKSAQRLFSWALSVGLSCSRFTQSGRRIPFFRSFQWSLADRLVFRKIRSRLGLQRLKLFFSGGAPLQHGTAEFFAALRLNIMEGYGLTETSPLVSVNRLEKLKFGTVGLPVNGVELRIAWDGEILVRGPNVMEGYYNKPAETALAIDPEGWLYTGDMGELDSDGYLKIVDRKKNLIVLSNGKKVAPQPLENRLEESPFVANVVVLGDHRSTITALIMPSFTHLRQWVREMDLHVNLEDDSAIIGHREVERLFRGEIERLLPELADFEKIRRFGLIPEPLTVDDGTLTPTMKVKRRVVIERYRDKIEALYR